MAPKRGLTGKDAFTRMNFLYQAAVMCSSFSSNNSQVIAAYYGSVFKNVAKKAVTRADPEIKRTLCKGCNALLVPGKNVRINLKKKPAPRLIWTCKQCFTMKRFGVRNGYKIWLECDEAVVEKTTYSNSVDGKQVEQGEGVRCEEGDKSVLHEDCANELKVVCLNQPVLIEEEKSKTSGDLV